MLCSKVTPDSEALEADFTKMRCYVGSVWRRWSGEEMTGEERSGVESSGQEMMRGVEG